MEKKEEREGRKKQEKNVMGDQGASLHFHIFSQILWTSQLYLVIE